MKEMELKGKHAVVTGGGKGIGLAIARSLVRAGASVTLMGRDAAVLGRVAAEMGAQSIAVDLLDETAAGHAFDDAAKLAGPVDILINNVGGEKSSRFEKTSRADWDGMLALNLTVAFTCMQKALPEMKRRGFGRIVNVASTASLKGYPYVAAYCAAKHGLLGLTRAVALETAKTGVTVNAVCPGFTETDLLQRSLATIVDATGRTEEDARADLLKANPQGRFILPEEVAEAVLWLCSAAAGSVTGQAISINGGEI